ncbi:MAG: ATP-grasp domain-containing protein [Clostridia bacterium]|nr:ATP-grasp domain-containing protein [Clostridia bacterium]
MKKLLLLGGSRYILPVIEVAHKLGVYVITCDYLPNNIAHKHSDQYINVSIIDKEEVLRVAKENNIDGVMSFACDPGVTTAAYVAEQMNLPSVGSYEAVSILQNKGLFRNFLENNGFNVPVSKSFKKNDDYFKYVNIFNWPVIVKPTDSAGSKGVSRVDEPSKLKNAIEIALDYSISGEYIIEDFLEQEGFSSDCDSFSINGKMEFFSFNSQRFDFNAENPYTPASYSWPTSMSSDELIVLKNEIQRLITLLNLKTSIYNIETRKCKNGKVYIMECSPRGGGNRLSEMVRFVYGVDLIEASVRAALGLDINTFHETKSDKFFAEIILHSEKSGVFKGLFISNDLSRCVIEKDLWITEGVKIGGFKGANEAIGTVVLRFDDINELENVLKNQNNYIRVMVE